MWNVQDPGNHIHYSKQPTTPISNMNNFFNIIMFLVVWNKINKWHKSAPYETKKCVFAQALRPWRARAWFVVSCTCSTEIKLMLYFIWKHDSLSIGNWEKHKICRKCRKFNEQWPLLWYEMACLMLRYVQLLSTSANISCFQPLQQ